MRKFVRNNIVPLCITLFAAVAIVVISMSAAGCESFDAQKFTSDTQAAVGTAHASIDSEKAKWQAAYQEAQITGDIEGAAKAKASIDLLNSMDTKLSDSEAQFNKTIGQITDENGNVDPEKAASAGAALLPYPYNVLAGIAIPGVGLLIREIQNSRKVSAAKAESAAATQTATEIVAALDAFRKVSPVGASEMGTDAAKTAMHEQMSVPTYKFVEELRNT